MTADGLSNISRGEAASSGNQPLRGIAPESAAGADVAADDTLLEQARTNRRNLFDAQRFAATLADAALDAVVAITGPNVTYTGGAFTRGWDPLQLAVTTADGIQVLVLPDDYAQYFGEYSWIADIRVFHIGEDMFTPGFSLLADVLDELGLEGAHIGLEGAFRPDWARHLEQRLPAATWADAGPVFERARLIKTPGEIDLFRVAVLRTQEAMRAAWAGSLSGDTEKEISARVQSAALFLGADAVDHTQLQAGVHSTVAMAASLERPVQAGEVIHMDFGAVFAGYHTDLARNAVVSAPRPGQADIYRRLAEIQRTLIGRVKAGVVAEELAELYGKCLDRIELQHPWSTTAVGHGTGLSVHEGFIIAEGCKVVLEPGMLINLEPSHIESGDARYHIEDTLVVREDGCELLGNLLNSPDLEVIQ